MDRQRRVHEEMDKQIDQQREEWINGEMDISTEREIDVYTNVKDRWRDRKTGE
jgi:hypothetical protein